VKSEKKKKPKTPFLGEQGNLIKE